MAIIYEGITCALCGKVINNELLDADEFVATTHFIDDGSSPLWMFSDAAMHKSCFMAWPLRQEFVQAHNEAMKEVKDRHGLHGHMTDEGEIISHNDKGEFVPIDEEAEEEFLNNYLASIGALIPQPPQE